MCAWWRTDRSCLHVTSPFPSRSPSKFNIVSMVTIETILNFDGCIPILLVKVSLKVSVPVKSWHCGSLSRWLNGSRTHDKQQPESPSQLTHCASLTETLRINKPLVLNDQDVTLGVWVQTPVDDIYVVGKIITERKNKASKQHETPGLPIDLSTWLQRGDTLASASVQFALWYWKVSNKCMVFWSISFNWMKRIVE